MAPSNPDSYVLQEPKTRLHPGITGPKMAADTPHREPEPQPQPQPSDHKDPTAADDSYSGLEVVETGIEVVPASPLPEALPSPHQHQHQQQLPSQLPQMQYAEYKPWAEQYSPPQPLAPHPGYPPQPATAPDYRYNGGHNPFEPAQGGGGGRICGLRRVVFWAALAIAAFAVVAAVAVGLGVGLGTRSSAGAPSATSPAASTVTNSLPAATATATAGPEVSIVCPSANLTLYSLTNSSSSSSSSAQEFLVFCGRDYNSSGGAEDMVSVNTTTFEACLEECANQEGCVAVGWGNYYGLNTCWLKSAIGEPNWSEGWYSAVAT